MSVRSMARSTAVITVALVVWLSLLAGGALAAVTPGWECIPTAAGQPVVSGGTGSAPSCSSGTAVLAPTYVSSGVGGRPTVRFAAVNVQILNGAGATASKNGTGNLVLGYDENPGALAQSGSHDLILGRNHSFTGYAQLLAGFQNTAAGNYAAVLGENNTAPGQYATVTGGQNNAGKGTAASVSGGYGNTSAGGWSAVTGGYANTAAPGYNQRRHREHDTAGSPRVSEADAHGQRNRARPSDERERRSIKGRQRSQSRRPFTRLEPRRRLQAPARAEHHGRVRRATVSDRDASPSRSRELDTPPQPARARDLIGAAAARALACARPAALSEGGACCGARRVGGCRA